MCASSAQQAARSSRRCRADRAAVVVAELAPRQTSNNSSSVPMPPGQGDERVRRLRHLQLAFVHRVDDAQLLQAAMAQLARHQPCAGSRPAPWPPAASAASATTPHQAGAAAAVDEAPAALADRAAQALRGLREARVVAGARAAVDGDGEHHAERSSGYCGQRGRRAAARRPRRCRTGRRARTGVADAAAPPARRAPPRRPGRAEVPARPRWSGAAADARPAAGRIHTQEAR